MNYIQIINKAKINYNYWVNLKHNLKLKIRNDALATNGIIEVIKTKNKTEINLN